MSVLKHIVPSRYKVLALLSSVPPVWAVVAILILVGCTPRNGGAEATTNEEKRAKIDAMYAEFQPDFPDAEEIDVEGFLRLRARGEILLVDVREDDERAISIIPGSISKEAFEKMNGDLGDIPIVVHCTIGYRSARYVESLKDRGVHAYNLKGSILSWVHAGQPVVDPGGNETKRVHVYGKRWDLLPEGYEAVW